MRQSGLAAILGIEVAISLFNYGDTILNSGDMT